MSLKFYIGHKSDFTYWISSCLMIKPKVVSEDDFYFETFNHEDFVADAPSLNINIDYRAMYNQTKASGTLIDCVSLFTSMQDELRVIIYKKGQVNEISCNAIFLFREKFLQKGVKTFYTLTTFKINELGILKEVEKIPLDSNIELISFLKYHSPKSFLVDNTDTTQISIATYNYPSNPLLHTNSNLASTPYHKGYNCRETPFSLNVQISEKDLILIFESSKTVFSRDFTVISHASFDPGPEEKTEYTDWLVRGILKFFSVSDLRQYVHEKKISHIDDNSIFNENFPKYPYNKILRFYSKSYVTPSFNSIKEAESSLGIKLSEQWKWGQY